jgi:hypothetical protein
MKAEESQREEIRECKNGAEILSSVQIKIPFLSKRKQHNSELFGDIKEYFRLYGMKDCTQLHTLADGSSLGKWSSFPSKTPHPEPALN